MGAEGTHGKILSNTCKQCAERTLARCRDLLAHCHRAKTLRSTELRMKPRGVFYVPDAPSCKICIATVWQWCVTSLFLRQVASQRSRPLERGEQRSMLTLCVFNMFTPSSNVGSHVCGHLGAHHVDIATLQILAEVGF